MREGISPFRKLKRPPALFALISGVIPFIPSIPVKSLLKTKQSEPVVIIEHFADAEGRQVGEYDSDETTHPVRTAEKIFSAEGQPEEKTFANRREGFGNRQVKGSRCVEIFEHQRRQYKHDDRVSACRKPNAAQQFLAQGDLRREAEKQNGRFDQDRYDVAKWKERPKVIGRYVLRLNKIYFIEKEHISQ